MSEHPDDPATKELHDRISQLEAAVVGLTQKLQEVDQHHRNMSRLNIEHRELIEKDVLDAFERIKNIELKLFPKLAGDIIRLNDIIGEGDQKAWNPLDQRKP